MLVSRVSKFIRYDNPTTKVYPFTDYKLDSCHMNENGCHKTLRGNAAISNGSQVCKTPDLSATIEFQQPEIVGLPRQNPRPVLCIGL